MAETFIEEQIEKDTEKTPNARLENFLRENNVKVFTAADFNFPKDEKTQAKIRAEADEFLQMREEDRSKTLKR